MGAMATAGGRPIGCTQFTEILNTPGAVLVGLLPKEFELATVYTAGVCARAALPDFALRLAALLGDDGTRSLRQRLGFEPLA
jgi:molybdate transport system substrate-binding protein